MTSSQSTPLFRRFARLTPAAFTTLGWEVRDVDAVATALEERGIALERYRWLEQDARGVWQAPGGARIAWFRDPDGICCLSRSIQRAE